MNPNIRLGMLTPSSNTVLEPVTSAMLQELSECTAHFARFPVTEIAISDGALAQFDPSAILKAASLLADCRPHSIAWNGTSAGWLGFDADERLCEAIEANTGIKACTSVLALNEIFRRRGITRFGLVTPYRDDVQAHITANYRQAGFDCVAERHLDIQENFTFAHIPPDDIRKMVREVAASKPQAITIFCTNLCGAPLAAELEEELGIPIYDTVSTVVWKSLQLAGVDTSRLSGWGSIFKENF